MTKPSSNLLWITEGATITNNDRSYVIIAVADINQVLAKDFETGQKVLLKIGDIGPPKVIGESNTAPRPRRDILSITDEEWETWKKKSDFYQKACASESAEALVRDLTGLIPLYLNAMEDLKGDLSERLVRLKTTVGAKISSDLAMSSQLLCHTGYSRRTFIRQMAYALMEAPQSIDERVYDHRYFYYDGSVLRPVNGLVRAVMRDYLDSEMSEDF